MKIPFAKVACDGNELKYIQEVLASGWLTTAGKTFEFEQRFGGQVGAKYACAVNSCTAALHLALEAIGIGPGDKVLVPTLTFTATAEVIRYLGADPVFVDVDYHTCLLTPEILADALARHPDIKAVMVVHFGGQAAQMLPMPENLKPETLKPETAQCSSGFKSQPSALSPQVSSLSSQVSGFKSQVSGFSPQVSSLSPQVSSLSPQVSGLKSQVSNFKSQVSSLRSPSPGILEICRQHGVKVIEDAAHAFPTRHQGRMVGSFGDITCFSFYANKTITTGEGGMLVTEDEAIYKRVKTMRLHGINRDIWDRFTGPKASWEYDVVAPGFKYNMPDINAAIGLAQLERADAMRAGRQRCFEYYLENLGGLDCIDLPWVRGALADHSCHLFWLVLKESAPITRNQLIERLNEAGIGTSVHYKPLHRMTYYHERYHLNEQDFPNAEKHWRGCVSLPIYPGLTNEELAYVVAEVKRNLKLEG